MSTTTQIYGITDSSGNLINVPIQNDEYTSSLVLQEYLSYMTTFQNVMNSSTTPTSTDYANLMTAIQGLSNLAKNGAVDSTTGLNYYMSSTMATNVSFVFGTLNAAGISATNPITDSDPATQASLQAQAVSTWQSLGSVGVASAISNSISSPEITNSVRTLQSMVEIDYVKTGNDIIFSHLSSLEQALTLTQNVLNTLQTIQNIASLVAVQHTGNANITSLLNQLNTADHTSLAGWIQDYQTRAPAFFSAGIPTPTITSTDAYNLFQSYMQLKNEIVSLVSANPSVTVNTVNSMPFYLQQLVNTFNVQNLNFNQLATTYQSAGMSIINGQLVDNGTGNNGGTATGGQIFLQAYAWVANAAQMLPGTQIAKTQNIGSYLEAPGQIQNAISQAITATQTLNSQQQLNVQNYQFIFQQFEQSASMVLQKTTQIIETLAQNMAR